MPLYGTLKSMPLPDLMQWLGTTRKTGTLLIERNKISKSILFNKGRVVGCSSDDPPERLGHFLLARGKITEEQLRDALALQATSRKYLGMILVEFGVFAPEELESLLNDKAEETIFSLFDWEDGVFRFEDEIAEGANIFPVNLEVQDVLLQGLKRFDEIVRIREVFDDPNILLALADRRPTPELFQDPMARSLYEAVNGERTIADILLHVHGSEFLVTKYLYDFYSKGLITIVGVKNPDLTPVAPQPAPAPEATAPAPDPPGARAPAREATAYSGGSPAPESAPAQGPAAAATAPTPTAAPATATKPAATPPVAAAPTPAPIVPQTEQDEPLLSWEPSLDLPARPENPATAAAPTPATEPIGGGLESADKSESHQLSRRLEAARLQVASGEFEEALDRLDQLYRDYPGDEALRGLTSEAEAAFVEKAYRHYLPPTKIPELSKPMEELATRNLSPTEFFMLSRIDGTWDIRSIIQIAPMRESDALRTLKRLREAGIIDLRDPE